VFSLSPIIKVKNIKIVMTNQTSIIVDKYLLKIVGYSNSLFLSFLT